MALLLLRRGRRRLITGLAIAAGGFTLGSLPHWVYGLQHGTALPTPGSWIGLAQIFDTLGLTTPVDDLVGPGLRLHICDKVDFGVGAVFRDATPASMWTPTTWLGWRRTCLGWKR